MARAIILVMDSFGLGATEDAPSFGDQGADTLGHIASHCAEGKADNALRNGPLTLPNLVKRGLGLAAKGSSGHEPAGLELNGHTLAGAYGHAAEVSKGKDTPSGHWEIAGLPVEFDWGFFPNTVPSFPDELIEEFIREANIPGILGNCHASGTEIIAKLGEEHIRTGKPICYTSADSVFQIAAHEEHFGLDRLYEICEIAKRLTKKLEVGRVIARPFIGQNADDFARTGNRRDYTTLPHADTLLDLISAQGNEVISIGKIADIFAGKGITRKVKANGNMALFDATLDVVRDAPDGSLVFTNFVDFDSSFGHRRDVAGYANALEEFDQRLPELDAILKPGDLVLITADHGCDPTWPGSDHTREHVPVIFYGPGIEAKNLGRRRTFADMGQTIATHLDVGPLAHGTACF
ncbi:phosphopentomutase [Aestuariispira insulae]|uniref:Phosphopentomutase n=1 Tax=Aestuariispira insulae TaxID=1461337 RepID=A0A3D9HMY5_9PROT|nr:phosphopentomutase [Aestuariispira insulae]RED50862.1 phosphopentomutase [Aestuariispira insulae]